ncbi:MAG: hypothetical protein RLZ54_613 [Candidatus Parcubacteria bacterium]|jgi:hypothetical protein
MPVRKRALSCSGHVADQESQQVSDRMEQFI